MCQSGIFSVPKGNFLLRKYRAEQYWTCPNFEPSIAGPRRSRVLASCYRVRIAATRAEASLAGGLGLPDRLAVRFRPRGLAGIGLLQRLLDPRALISGQFELRGEVVTQ